MPITACPGDRLASTSCPSARSLADKVLDHRQRHIGFQQRHAHFAQHVLDIGLGDARLAAKIFDYAGKPAGEIVKHDGC
jgi:ubiquinone/menaquinone biosynthesis C-methylase UbiE